MAITSGAAGGRGVRGTCLAAAVAFGLLWGGTGSVPEATGSSPPAASSQGEPLASPLLEALERLESVHDAKCHSSASRFEDFLYGTPLGEAAQIANVEQQKRVARRLWSGASRAALAAG
ncbi:MAG: hypothetical protein E4H11_05130, partial [Myxococcales bacterium]